MLVKVLPAALSALFASSAALVAGAPVIGLITKTDTNPFFVKMKAMRRGC